MSPDWLQPYRNPWRKLWQSLALPKVCALCGTAGQDFICPGCRADLPTPVSACARCARPLAPGRPAALCGACLRRPPRFAATQAAFVYAYPLDRLILAGKFQADLAALAFLGECMADAIDPGDPPPDALIPVPMHPLSLRLRGYNQAVQLARPLARRYQIPLALDACRCVRLKRRQAQLAATERVRNVRGAFAAHRVSPAWRRVVLVDDVMTTGATTNELSRVLLRAGVAQVDVWCCARRP